MWTRRGLFVHLFFFLSNKKTKSCFEYFLIANRSNWSELGIPQFVLLVFFFFFIVIIYTDVDRGIKANTVRIESARISIKQRKSKVSRECVGKESHGGGNARNEFLCFYRYLQNEGKHRSTLRMIDVCLLIK